MQVALARVGWIGALVGLIVMTLFLPGGDDGYNFYLRSYWPGATAPIWVFLFTAPTAPLAWPLRWTVLVIASVLGGVWARRAIGDQRWWILLFSHAFFMNLWLGQIEAFPVVGIGLAWLVMQRKTHPLWFGIALLALMTKIQVGVGLALLFTFWIGREQGQRALLWAAGAVAGVIGVSLLMYPDWPANYLTALNTLAPQNQFWNASIFPIGLLALPFAFYPGDVGKIRRARMIACVTLLASPYFAWYHPSTAMLLETRGAMMWLSWLDAVPRVLWDDKHSGWIVLIIMLAWDVWQIRQERRHLAAVGNGRADE